MERPREAKGNSYSSCSGVLQDYFDYLFLLATLEYYTSQDHLSMVVI